MKNDFHDKLKRYGRLPNSNLNKKFQQMEELQYYKNLKENLFPNNKKKKDVKKHTVQSKKEDAK